VADESLLRDINTGACISVEGLLVESQGKGQAVEIQAESVVIFGKADPDKYPLQPKKHSMEFLRSIAHLRPRTQTISAVLRIRHALSFAIHKFFNDKGFYYLHTPIITGSDAEGAGEMFRVTTLDMTNPPKTEEGVIDYKEDFFGKETNLTVSGQLEGEVGALAMGEVYTFGPTFRAENSNTTRHLAEFWMVEPEMAFYDLDQNMDLAEEMLSFIVSSVLTNKKEELEILERDLSKLTQVVGPFPRISYTEALELLKSEKTKLLLDEMEASRNEEKTVLKEELDAITKEYNQAKKGRKVRIDARKKAISTRLDEIEEDFRNIPVWRASIEKLTWGEDLGGSDETLLTMQFDKPVMVYNYPAEAKAFYMKKDPSNPKVVKAVDVLAPEGYGEIIGGSQREDNLDILLEGIHKHDLPEEAFDWYIDLRKYGTVPHSGFGLGIERTVSWICGLHHVRETIPFPRMLGRLYP
jgi:asparaginyl-tRNA synthetase